MTTTNKVVPIALVAALLGGTVGAFVMRPSSNTPDTQVASAEMAKANGLAATENVADKNAAATDQNNDLDNEIAAQTKNMTDDERAAFRDGFMQGVEAARDSNVASVRRSSAVVTRTRYVSRNAPRRVYYDYGQRSGRSFWQKHRDKLTVAMGAGGGALLGGLIGGKKGAGIGALAGAGGSALWTYKLRRRHRNY